MTTPLRLETNVLRDIEVPLDPKVKELLDLAANAPPVGSVPVEEMREGAPSQMAAWYQMGLLSTPVAAVEDRVIPGPAGGLPVRVYTPAGRGPFPLVVFFHGGGWVLGSLDTHDPMCRALCAGAGCVVVSVGYRLAPEHRFPAAVDDALAATRWLAANAAEIGGDPRRVAVAGDSAGGNLATVTTLRIRDEGGPALRGQLLIYPAVGYHTPPTPSYIENTKGYGMTREATRWFYEQYLVDESQASHPHVAPLFTPDLGGLPPALVITAQYDVLRDEGQFYVARLRESGVQARLSRYEGVHHRFAELLGILDQADRARDEMCALEGELDVQLGTASRTLRPGEAATAYKSVLHRFHNSTKEPARFLVELRPGHSGFEKALRVAYGLAADGLAAANGAPKNPYHLALAFEWGESRLPGVFAAMEPVFRLLAKRARRKGIDRELEARYLS